MTDGSSLVSLAIACFSVVIPLGSRISSDLGSLYGCHWWRGRPVRVFIGVALWCGLEALWVLDRCGGLHFLTPKVPIT